MPARVVHARIALVFVPLAVLLGLGGAGEALAQGSQQAEVALGDSVRLTIPGTLRQRTRPVAGVLLSAADPLVIRTDSGTLTLPASMLIGLEVFVERRSRAGSALKGLGLGAALGGVTGAVLGFADGDDPPCMEVTWMCMRFSAGDKAMILGVLFGGTGGLAGGVIGLLRPTEVWRRIEASDIDVGAFSTPDGVVGLSLRVPLR